MKDCDYWSEIEPYVPHKIPDNLKRSEQDPKIRITATASDPLFLDSANQEAMVNSGVEIYLDGMSVSAVLMADEIAGVVICMHELGPNQELNREVVRKGQCVITGVSSRLRLRLAAVYQPYKGDADV